MLDNSKIIERLGLVPTSFEYYNSISPNKSAVRIQFEFLEDQSHVFLFGRRQKIDVFLFLLLLEAERSSRAIRKYFGHLRHLLQERSCYCPTLRTSFGFSTRLCEIL